MKAELEDVRTQRHTELMHFAHSLAYASSEILT